MIELLGAESTCPPGGPRQHRIIDLVPDPACLRRGDL